MRIPSGSTDRNVYFVAVDATDLKTRETGLSSFTVVRSRDGAADVTYTTPTVTEIDATTMPGVYALTLDEDTTIAAGHDTEEYCLHITQASMAPVTRVLELYRVKFTEGQSATMANSAVDADVERWAGAVVNALVSGRVDSAVGAMAAAVLTAAAIAADAITDAKVASDVTIASVTGAVGSVTGNVGGNVAGSVGSVAAGGITAPSFALDAIDAAAIKADAANELADALLDRATAIEGLTPRQLLRLMASVLLGKASGLDGETAVYRDLADTKARVTATVDEFGNRTAVVRDAA